jgi:hypothetical protein
MRSTRSFVGRMWTFRCSNCARTMLARRRPSCGSALPPGRPTVPMYASPLGPRRASTSREFALIAAGQDVDVQSWSCMTMQPCGHRAPVTAVAAKVVPASSVGCRSGRDDAVRRLDRRHFWSFRVRHLPSAESTSTVERPSSRQARGSRLRRRSSPTEPPPVHAGPDFAVPNLAARVWRDLCPLPGSRDPCCPEREVGAGPDDAGGCDSNA